jgi:hypothetical protein
MKEELWLTLPALVNTFSSWEITSSVRLIFFTALIWL